MDDMADKLDELIKSVATLVADVKHVREKTDAIDNKVQVLNDKSIVSELTIQTAHKRMDQVEPIVLALDRRMSVIEPIVQQMHPLITKHETVFVEASGGKKALSGVWAIVIAIGSFFGMVASWLFKT